MNAPHHSVGAVREGQDGTRLGEVEPCLRLHGGADGEMAGIVGRRRRPTVRSTGCPLQTEILKINMYIYICIKNLKNADLTSIFRQHNIHLVSSTCPHKYK